MAHRGQVARDRRAEHDRQRQDHDRHQRGRREGGHEGEKETERDDLGPNGAPPWRLLPGRERLQPGCAAHPRHHKGHPGEGHESLQVTCGDAVPDEREAEIGDRGRKAGPARAERPQQPVHPDGAHEDRAQQEQLLHLRGAAEQDRTGHTHQAETGGRRPGRLPSGVMPAAEEVAQQRARRRKRQELAHQRQVAGHQVADAEQDHDGEAQESPAGVVRQDGPVAARGDPPRLEILIRPEPGLEPGCDRGGREDRGDRTGLESRAPVAPAQHPRHDTVGSLADDRERLAGSAQATAVAPVPPPGVGDALRALPLAPQRRHGHLRERSGREVEHDGQASRRVVVLEHRPQLVAPTQQSRVAGPPRAGPRHLQVAHARRGSDDDPRPGHLGSPAQVHVLAEQLDVGIEAAERPEKVGPHQDDAAGHGEHLTTLVVLGLVELARLDPLDCHAEAVDPEADLQQPVRGVPLDELRPDDAGVGAVGLTDQATDRIG